MGRLAEAAFTPGGIGRPGLEDLCRDMNDRRQARGIKTFYSIDRSGPIWRLVAP
jgi:hypothetical protein